MASEEPFIGSEAVHSGTLRPHQLRSRFRLVYPDAYVRRDQQLTLRHRAVAAWLWSHRRGVLVGLTAAAWHGSKGLDERLPIELVWSNARPPPDLRTYVVRLGHTWTLSWAQPASRLQKSPTWPTGIAVRGA